jgi:carbon monoxide dehydrogenase subunit G
MQTVERILVKAPPQTVWQVLEDVQRWPHWTPTVLQVEPLNADNLRVGARYRITQPKLRPSVYQVTVCDPQKALTWVQKGPGMSMIADHRLSGDSSGTEVELSFATEGLLGAILGGIYSKLITEYVATEARSLKTHCESLEASSVVSAGNRRVANR